VVLSPVFVTVRIRLIWQFLLKLDPPAMENYLASPGRRLDFIRFSEEKVAASHTLDSPDSTKSIARKLSSATSLILGLDWSADRLTVVC